MSISKWSSGDLYSNILCPLKSAPISLIMRTECSFFITSKSISKGFVFRLCSRSYIKSSRFWISSKSIADAKAGCHCIFVFIIILLCIMKLYHLPKNLQYRNHIKKVPVIPKNGLRPKAGSPDFTFKHFPQNAETPLSPRSYIYTPRRPQAPGKIQGRFHGL